MVRHLNNIIITDDDHESAFGKFDLPERASFFVLIPFNVQKVL
jgi:hypothetical protein